MTRSKNVLNYFIDGKLVSKEDYENKKFIDSINNIKNAKRFIYRSGKKYKTKGEIMSEEAKNIITLLDELKEIVATMRELDENDKENKLILAKEILLKEKTRIRKLLGEK